LAALCRARISFVDCKANRQSGKLRNITTYYTAKTSIQQVILHKISQIPQKKLAPSQEQRETFDGFPPPWLSKVPSAEGFGNRFGKGTALARHFFLPGY